MSALAIAFLLSLLPSTVGPTWTWPDAERVSTCDDDDWNVEEAALERGQRCARHEAEEDASLSFAWGG